MRSLVLLLALCSATAALSQPADLKADEKLVKPLTLKLKIAPLEEVLKAISIETGATLDAATSVEDLKVNVLVKGEPAWRIMNKIADVLGCEWRQDGSLYRICMPSEWQSRAAGFLDIEDRHRRREAQAKVNEYLQAVKIPYEQIPQRIEELSKNEDRLSARDKEDLRILRFGSDPSNYFLGRVFASMNSARWTAFWNGDVVHGTIPFAPPERNVDERGREPRRGGPPRMLAVFAKYDPLSGQLLTRMNQGRGGDRRQELLKDPIPTGELADTLFGKAVLAWETPLKSEDQRLKRAVTAPGHQRATAADILESIHDASEAPIVSTAFRVLLPVGQLPSGSALQVFSAFKQRSRGFGKVEDGYVLYRHGGFWRLRTMEPPEKLVRPLEEKETPTLDDFADYISKLNPAQTYPYTVPNTAFAKFDADVLRDTIPALRFFGSLSRSQRNSARSEAAIFAPQLSANQRQLYADAVADAVFSGAQVLGGFDRFSVDWNDRAATALGFIVIPSEVVIGNVSHGGSRMIFGFNRNNGVAYAVRARGS